MEATDATSTAADSQPLSLVDEVAEEHFRAELGLSPWKQLDVGIGERTGKLDDYSPAGLTALNDLNRRTLSRLDDAVARTRSARTMSRTDEVTADALHERLTAARDLHDAGLDTRNFNVIESAPQLIRDFFDMLPTHTPADWDLNVTSLRSVPRALDGYRETVATTLEAGTPPTALQTTEVAAQARTLATAGGHFDAFAATASATEGVPTALAEDAVLAAYEARRAYAQFAEFLTDEVLPRAGDDDACGRDEYALHSRFFLGEDIDVNDTFAWALDDLARIDAQQQRIVRELGLSDTLPGTFAALADSPRYRLHGVEALINWMQHTADHAIDELGKDTFDIPTPLSTIECRVQPDGTGVVFYSRPTADFSRPGRMWWSVPTGVDRFSTWQEKSTVYHEGVPGHHLQYGTATLMTDQLNAWRRQGCWVSGHGEGWALYAEQLMADLGFHSDPADMLGMLDSQRLRTVRICIDIGVHCRLAAPASMGGGTWDRQKAWDFLTANLSMPDHSRRFEHARYMGWPGQASSYRVGERLWRQIKEETQARKGATFSAREFHRDALETGSVGLRTLRRAAEGF